jgi:hypothetical protein
VLQIDFHLSQAFSDKFIFIWSANFYWGHHVPILCGPESGRTAYLW